ncbi:MAG: hypothetical protein WA817_00860, partial [Candidatus Acidiferrum sp.]
LAAAARPFANQKIGSHKRRGLLESELLILPDLPAGVTAFREIAAERTVRVRSTSSLHLAAQERRPKRWLRDGQIHAVRLEIRSSHPW